MDCNWKDPRRCEINKCEDCSRCGDDCLDNFYDVYEVQDSKDKVWVRRDDDRRVKRRD